MAELKFIVPINAAPAKVYAAVATQAGMRSWWTADTRMEEKAGGKAEFGFEKRGMIFRMTIDRLDPGGCVVMSCHGDQPEWNGTTLRWDIAKGEAGDGATLCFVHSGWREITDFCASCNAMWGNLMLRAADQGPRHLLCSAVAGLGRRYVGTATQTERCRLARRPSSNARLQRAPARSRGNPGRRSEGCLSRRMPP